MIEAACSHYHLLTQEAISREKNTLTAIPATAQTEKRIKQLEQGAGVLRCRQENCEKKEGCQPIAYQSNRTRSRRPETQAGKGIFNFL
ncbi:hypothetical protein Ppb6_00082 [Photorhabdus australis subsp. thailandensis]|uniref:Uncharacterized protein n=1 Tax=Photorhabdus australis subsp. thailandensis TaxID=2805096 RepID=A0A1C0U9W9_9GAMM|nr:hypothetical protein Ppb6_00082 [Photorhabdus australis subsp. thailandensis]